MHDRSACSAAGQRLATVVCLHGSAGTPRQWRRLAERLAGRYRVVTPGLIGYTDGPAWRAEQGLTLDQEAAWVERWLDGAGDKVHLVGHSYGGAVALRVALRRPDRVRSLAFYEPALFKLLTGDALTEILAVRSRVQRHCQAGEPAAAAQLFVDYWSGMGAWRRLPAVQQGGIAQRMSKVVAEFDAVFSDGTPVSRYTRLTVPILFLSGALAPAPTARVARLVQNIFPSASRIELPGLGHMGPVTHPDVVNALVALFLDSQHRLRTTDHAVELARAA
jgi:pimeloyl-ACP methyl ester carboxylesterase